MARPWDSTLYVVSHYPAFSPRPKCPECFDLGVPVVPREFASSAALPVAIAPLAIVVAPAPLVIAPPELNPAGLSQPRL